MRSETSIQAEERDPKMQAKEDLHPVLLPVSVVPSILNLQAEGRPAKVWLTSNYLWYPSWDERRLAMSDVIQMRFVVLTAALFCVSPVFGQLVRQPNTTLALSESSPPPTLSATGAFADLATLTPNIGIVPFTPNVSFWSDYAQKQRWFSIPDVKQTMTFNADGNWTLPTGTVWIKHFNLPNERTNPSGPSRRIETRFLVKTATDVYGLTYRWRDDQTDADLVGPYGDDVPYSVLVNGAPTKQVWRYPARGECVFCHTDLGGYALGFNTRQMNGSHIYGGLTQNQIQALSDAGYFSAPVVGVNNLPAFAKATDTSQNLEWRVRSYLGVNCVQCHQPGGFGGGYWDARATTPLDEAGIINGMLKDNGGDEDNRFVVPGDLTHSMVIRRLEGDGVVRMPPVATNELDYGSIQLLTDWITQALPQRLSFTQWQLLYFGSTIVPEAAPGADPDGDGNPNAEEFLANTDPTRSISAFPVPQGSTAPRGMVQFQFSQPANRAAVVETTTDLVNWIAWDAPGNAPTYPPAAQQRAITTLSEPRRFFRLRLSIP